MPEATRFPWPPRRGERPTTEQERPTGLDFLVRLDWACCQHVKRQKVVDGRRQAEAACAFPHVRRGSRRSFSGPRTKSRCPRVPRPNRPPRPPAAAGWGACAPRKGPGRAILPKSAATSPRHDGKVATLNTNHASTMPDSSHTNDFNSPGRTCKSRNARFSPANAHCRKGEVAKWTHRGSNPDKPPELHRIEIDRIHQAPGPARNRASRHRMGASFDEGRAELGHPDSSTVRVALRGHRGPRPTSETQAAHTARQQARFFGGQILTDDPGISLLATAIQHHGKQKLLGGSTDHATAHQPGVDPCHFTRRSPHRARQSSRPQPMVAEAVTETKRDAECAGHETVARRLLRDRAGGSSRG